MTTVALPSPLRPWWPYLKRLHRLLTRLSGLLFRGAAPALGRRGVPRAATATAAETARREPAAVRLHPGRAGAVAARRATPGDPQDHPVFRAAGSERVPATFTLDIREGRLSGDFGAAVTPGNVLDGETSTYFGVSDWREHPVFLRPTLGRIEDVRGTVLSLTTRGAAINYYHFLYDAIGRYGVLEECLPELAYDAVVVPHATRYQRQLLELAGIHGPYIQPRRGLTVQARRLVVPSNPNWALQAPPATVAWLRARLRPSGAAGTPRRLYLTRGDVPRTRRYLQEAGLWPLLEARGFVRLDPGRFSVQDQIDAFSRAEVIVSPHGAALTNVTFSPPEVRVLELFPAGYVHLGLWAICQSLGARYRYLIADDGGATGGANAGIYDDVSIPPSRVLAALEELLAT